VYLGQTFSLFTQFWPEKGPLDVRLLWLALYMVALPTGDGLRPPHQGLHEVHQVLAPLKSCLKSDFIDKFADTYF
jgi:hypothetical protein